MSIEELERLRKKARNSIFIGLLANILIPIIFFIIFPSPNAFLAFGLVFVIVVGVITAVLYSIKLKLNFSSAFKETFVVKALESVFTDLVYEPDKGLDQSIIKNTGMMNMGNTYYSNDYISGKYKNTNVVQADVHIEEKRYGSKSSDYHTIFKGKWMIFDFNKRFKANIQVREKGFLNSKLTNRNEEIKYKEVKMEDQAFNKLFRTYAQDEYEAFYVLTPSLMEKIKKLADNVFGKLLFCFVDNKLHIAIQNYDDSFEHSIFIKINEEKVTNAISKDIKLITDFVDELNLDNALFRVEE